MRRFLTCLPLLLFAAVGWCVDTPRPLVVVSSTGQLAPLASGDAYQFRDAAKVILGTTTGTTWGLTTAQKQAWYGATPVVRQTGDVATALVTYGLITSPTIVATSAVDSTFRLVDDIDATKKLAWQVSGVTTGTTRTWTALDADMVVAGSAVAGTSGQVAWFTTGGLLTNSAAFKYAATTLTIGDGAVAGANFLIDTAVGTRSHQISTAGVRRWRWGGGAAAETGADAGSQWFLEASNDAGTAIDFPITVTRVAGGPITLVRPLTTSGNITQTGVTSCSFGTGVFVVNGITTHSARVGIGSSGSAASPLVISTAFVLTTGTSQYGILNQFTGQSGATTRVVGNYTDVNLAAAAFTTADLVAFSANIGAPAIGAGSSATRWAGFQTRTLTYGGTANFGYYYGGSGVLTGTGTWGFYNATADANYLGTGSTIFGASATSVQADINGGLGTPTVQINGTSGGTASLTRWAASAGAPTFILGKSRSATVGTFGIVSASDRLGAIDWNGDDGVQMRRAASITVTVDGTPGAGDMPGKMWFSTSADGAAAPTDRLSIDALGQVLALSPLGGIGYGTGAGGTVTQITSRVTGVTLNKVSGAITLVSAAGSATYQTFIVTNSACGANDTPKVVQKSGTDLYEIHVTAVTAGTFNVTFRTTGGTTVEQPVFNFTIVKGASS